MAYDIPLKKHAQPVSVKCERFVVVLPRELRERMARHPLVNWSQVARDALEIVCTRKEGEGG